jgi:hypothetical protein
MRVDNFMYGNTDERPPPAPDKAFELMAHGSIAAVRSPRVAALLEEWSKAGWQARSFAFQLELIASDEFIPKERFRSTDDPNAAEAFDHSAAQHDDLLEQLEKAISSMSAAEAQIREQVWRELRGEDRGHIDATRASQDLGRL